MTIQRRWDKGRTTYGGNEDILAGCSYFEGQHMGAVVATDTEEVAHEALKLIEVEWEIRPFVLDQEEAIKPGAPAGGPKWQQII